MVDQSSWNNAGSKVKTRRATCGCGHEGRSKQPEHYQCGFCYYGAWVRSTLEKARKLEARAVKLRKEADVYQGKSDAFRVKHSDCGSAQRTE